MRESEKRSRNKANDKRNTMNANLSQLEARNRETAYIVPKDILLQPNIANRAIKPARKPLYPIHV